ncbi:protein croquemort-like isoform X1 [Epargyreus clarus]|uniref:protein croquemort-like isoform X1 n=1 Tax=Epargyreus clarus TaxID=520877 RepID=UPI003C2DD372
MSFGIWQEIPIPMYFECFLYNITNVDDILAGKKVKLRVQQMGPYVFREKQEKVNIVWNENSTLTYQTRRFWYFEPERSNGSLSDMVTNINPVIPAVAYVLRNEPAIMNMLANMLINMYNTHMFLTANASEWLFDGINNPILTITSKIPGFPYDIPFDKFGWLYTRNGSSDYDGIFVVNTGEADFSRLGKIEMWNHSNRTVYPGSCGEVRGSSGELWAPKKGLSEISLFAPDICTTLTLGANGTENIMGIEGAKFISNDSMFDNGQKYPSKACYCKGSEDNCMLSGALNVSACRYGAPAFVTLPHFRHLHPYYADKVDGLEPTEDHNFQMAIDMVTGMPLMVLAQLQVNVLVRHSPGITLNNQLPDPDLLVPMLWFREQVVVDGKYSSFAKLAINIYYWMSFAFYIITAIGVMLLASGLGIVKRRILKRHSVVTEAQIFLKDEKSHTLNSKISRTVSYYQN